LSGAELLTLVRRQQGQIEMLTRRVAQIEILTRRVAQLERELAESRRELAAARRELAAARKNSSNSSKPPSSDIVKPPRDDDSGRSGDDSAGSGGGSGDAPRRKIGGQPGHPRHERAPFPPQQVDRIHTHTLNSCPDCGGRLTHWPDQRRVVQQVELVAAPLCIEEHRSETYGCRRCGKTQRAPLPPAVEAGGLLGPRLTAIVAYLKGVCHASFSTIRRFFGDVLGLTLSRGYLAKLLRKATRSLHAAYDGLRRRLPEQPRLNVDETGHRENGARPWTWCFRAEDFTLFKIADSRGSDVLREMLGGAFGGVLGCDYFSAYRKYMKDADVRVQFCLAHLIRELKFMATLPDRPTVVYAESLLLAMRDLFAVIHRRAEMTPHGLARALRRRRDVIVRMATRRVPNTSEARNLAERFRIHGSAYFQFITTPDVPPTNNLAEQAIRFVVIDRHITQGTRGDAGRQWCERIWTVLATCAQQGRSAFEFMDAAIHALFHHRPTPMLLSNMP